MDIWRWPTFLGGKSALYDSLVSPPFSYLFFVPPLFPSLSLVVISHVRTGQVIKENYVQGVQLRCVQSFLFSSFLYLALFPLSPSPYLALSLTLSCSLSLSLSLPPSL